MVFRTPALSNADTRHRRELAHNSPWDDRSSADFLNSAGYSTKARRPLRSTRTEEHRDTEEQVNLRNVSELCHRPARTPGKRRHLRGHANPHRCCDKSLLGTALVGFGVRQRARAESISKRAPSTTRTSLRVFRSAVYRLVAEPVNPIVQRSVRRLLSRDHLWARTACY